MSFFVRRRLAKLSRRVKRGATLFDAFHWGWESEVDLDRLDVASMDHGPLGQVYGHLGAGMLALGLWGPSLAAHGFRCSRFARLLGLATGDYHTLNLLWANEILVRRRASRRLVAPPKSQTSPVLV